MLLKMLAVLIMAATAVLVIAAGIAFLEILHAWEDGDYPEA